MLSLLQNARHDQLGSQHACFLKTLLKDRFTSGNRFVCNKLVILDSSLTNTVYGPGMLHAGRADSSQLKVDLSIMILEAYAI